MDLVGLLAFVACRIVTVSGPVQLGWVWKTAGEHRATVVTSPLKQGWLVS